MTRCSCPCFKLLCSATGRGANSGNIALGHGCFDAYLYKKMCNVQAPIGNNTDDITSCAPHDTFTDLAL